MYLKILFYWLIHSKNHNKIVESTWKYIFLVKWKHLFSICSLFFKMIINTLPYWHSRVNIIRVSFNTLSRIYIWIILLLYTYFILVILTFIIFKFYKSILSQQSVLTQSWQQLLLLTTFNKVQSSFVPHFTRAKISLVSLFHLFIHTSSWLFIFRLIKLLHFKIFYNLIGKILIINFCIRLIKF